MVKGTQRGIGAVAGGRHACHVGSLRVGFGDIANDKPNILFKSENFILVAAIIFTQLRVLDIVDK